MCVMLEQTKQVFVAGLQHASLGALAQGRKVATNLPDVAEITALSIADNPF